MLTEAMDAADVIAPGGTNDLSLVSSAINFTFVENFSGKTSTASGDAEKGKGYKYFREAYVHNLRCK